MNYLNQLDYKIKYQTDGNNPVDLVITDSYFEQNNENVKYFPWNRTSIEDNFRCLKYFLEEFNFTVRK